LASIFNAAARGERAGSVDAAGSGNEGQAQLLSVAFSTVRSERGEPAGVSMVARDILGRKLAEEQLRRTEYHLRLLQKYEAMRRIAGGVAHEFNNLLTVISARGEFIRTKVSERDSIRVDLDQIVKAVERATTVTGQLLAFSRQQFLRTKAVQLNAIVENMLPLLAQLLGQRIAVEKRLAGNLDPVRADPEKMHDVIVSLALNAKDAMPNGGTLSFETASVEIDEDSARARQGFKPGRYALLAVTDSGCGMNQDTLAKIFEPFFTTKGLANRSGLGLAMVFGTIKQSDGFIYAASQPGQGTRFEMFLPLAEQPAVRPSPEQKPSAPANATILIVDDEPSLLEIVSFVLGAAGYTLLLANSPNEAIRLAEAHAGKIDLLLSDIVMPEMNGPELAIRLATFKPDMKVLFMSGYPENHTKVRGAGTAEFIGKPFVIAALVRKVEDVLAGNQP